MTKTSNPDYLNGVPELVLLKLLERRSMYGYELVRAIEQSTGEVLAFGEGCIYPVLHRLESDGSLESQRENFIVIGEDLGTVTDEGRAGLAETGILSYRLLWFERDGAGNFHPPGHYPANALASTTTHDLPTLAGYAAGRDLEARKAAGMADENEYQQQKAHRANEVQKLEWALGEAGFTGDPLGFLLATPCLLVLLNQEDLTGETEQQNLPGSTWQYPNWRRKMKVAVEECRPLAQKFRVLVEKSGRRPPHS